MKALIPDWTRAHRLVPCHYPPINLFETVSDPEDLELVFEIESLTNDRLRDETGDLRLVPASERIAGPGSSPVMAAFTHMGQPSRFTDGRFGVYYAGNSLDVALAETRYHRERFLAATQEPDTEITMREYISSICLPLGDIRSQEFAELHHPTDYSCPQQFARNQRQSGSHGILYNSVRHQGGECAALFTPKATSIPVQGGHYRYVWSGTAQKILSVLAVSLIE
ncbi:RES family NAD+ phosphorylase [Marinospirillum sp.]|uniref:RES family NAD+ phosphorylase n=1 Tax=Marinospirillum sp. TaxID=2183934 RepID=UPI00384F5306